MGEPVKELVRSQRCLTALLLSCLSELHSDYLFIHSALLKALGTS